MKKIFLLIVGIASILSTFGQATDAQLTTQANVIRNENSPGGNTKVRIADMFQALINSKQSIIGIVNSTGPANSYAITVTSAVSTYADKQWYIVKFNVGNSTASTINVNGIGAKAIKKNVVQDLEAGDIIAGGIYILGYDGTFFQLINGTSAGSGGAAIWGGITGTLSDQTDLQSTLDAKQALDADLTAIAGLTPSNDDVLQRKAGAWTNLTLAQLKTDLDISTIVNSVSGNVVDNTDPANPVISAWPSTGTFAQTGNVTIDGNTFNLNFGASSGDRMGNFRAWSNGTVGLDGATSSFLQSDNSTITASPDNINVTTGGGSLVINDTDFKVTDNRGTPRGLAADADYSANYQNLDYVSKLYTDTKTSLIWLNNEQATSYTGVLTDINKVVQMNSASALNFTVPPNSSVAYPIGTYLVVRQKGAGTVTIVEGVGVTVTEPVGGTMDTPGQGLSVTLHKTGTNTWDLENGSSGGGGVGGTWGSITGTLSDQTDLQSALDLKAPLSSPALTGNPTAPTQSAGNNSTRIATTAYADAKVAESITNGVTGIAPSQDQVFDALALKAPLSSPTFTGVPIVPTAAANTNNTQAASTGYTDAKVADVITDNVTTIAPSQNAVFDALGLKSNLLISANRQTGSYTLVLTDGLSKNIEMNVATSNNLTIPPNSSVAFPIGIQITVTQYGAGQTSIVAGSGVTIRSSSNNLLSPGRYSPMVLVHIDTDEWYLWNGTESTAQALTKIDDTNIIVTLGGSPSAALNAATSLTMGWSGLLAVTRGGLGLSSIAVGDIVYGSASNTFSSKNVFNATQTALMHFKAGTTAASTAPIKYTSGTLLTAIEAGAREFNGSHYVSSTSLNRVGIGGSIADFYADVSNSGTSETDIYTYTTKASTFTSNGEKLTFEYTLNLSDITSTAQIKVLFAGTTIGDTGALTVSAIGAVVVRGWIVRTGSSTARASVSINSPTASTAIYTAETDLTGLTFTNTNIIKVTGTSGGAGGGTGDITGKIGAILWWPAAAN